MDYKIDHPLSVAQYVDLLDASTLGERRPVHDPESIRLMLLHANLLATAWDGAILVGAARCFSDFAFVTYCSDLCVRLSHQRLGVGRQLLRTVLDVAPCRIVLLSAPKAIDYYPRIGFTQHPSAWTILPGELL